nr:ABC transporter ATP-binding protein [Bacillota bacterium]
MNKNVLMKLINITKTYVMGEVTVEALKETSLEIYEGELLVILGPSGSGKSTLLNIMGGMDLPSSGEVYFGSDNLSQAGEAKLTQYRRSEVGFVFQFYNLIPDLTASENVDLAANLVDSPLPTAEVLREVGMETRMDHFPAQLSGGEQQRVSIARAVVKNPRLLLCDEPA